MLYVRFPLSFRNVEGLLHERGIEIGHETVRFWWKRFAPKFAAEIRRKRINRMRFCSNCQRHLGEVFVVPDGETHFLWRTVDHEGEVLETSVAKCRDYKAASKFLRKSMKRYGFPKVTIADRSHSCAVVRKNIGNTYKQKIGRWKNG